MVKKTAVAKRAGTAVVSSAHIDRLAALGKEAKAIEESAGLGGNWITMRAGIMKFQNNEVKGSEMEVVIIDHLLENSYYPEKFEADTPVSPICFAFGTKSEDMKPHEASEKPQSDTCAKCKWNAFGTADTGRGKACKNTRRLAMIHSDALANADEVKATPIALTKLPVTSAKGWGLYVQKAANVLNTHPIGLITKFMARPDADTQVKASFEMVEQVKDDDLLDALMARREEAREQLMRPYSVNAERTAKPTGKAPAKKAAAKGAKRKF